MYFYWIDGGIDRKIDRGRDRWIKIGENRLTAQFVAKALFSLYIFFFIGAGAAPPARPGTGRLGRGQGG